MDPLETIAANRPYPGYQDWWPLGHRFLRMMQGAMVRTWQETCGGAEKDPVRLLREDAAHYINTVYRRRGRPDLVDQFLHLPPGHTLFSGEFDALSYAFFRSAFLSLNSRGKTAEVHQFTQVVGRRFFTALAKEAGLEIPNALTTDAEFSAMRRCIAQIGDFLVAEGYLRDSFEFTFEVAIQHQGRQIEQSAGSAAAALLERGRVFALYRMGYPAILPSAVYLFHTMGEAQHHSSRTIEELFSRAGCTASETPDFDPTGFPPREVVELWEIRRNTFQGKR